MRLIIYDDGLDFFRVRKGSSMVFTPKAAVEVCQEATRLGLFVLCVEGGHIIDEKFRPDMWTRWDAKKWLKESGDFKQNNELAIANIHSDVAEGYDAFTINIPNIKP